VFYSGRAAFSGRTNAYVVGLNPAGKPSSDIAETIGEHTRFVLEDAPDHWSTLSDESWRGAVSGSRPCERRVLHLFRGSGLDPRRTPASNLIFLRDTNLSRLGDFDDLVEACWPFHQRVLETLQPKVLLCLGEKAATTFCDRLGGGAVDEIFVESNNRGWKSTLRRTATGVAIVQLTHPSRADWTNPLADPTPLVRAALA
jgi:hypothetical protein